MLRRDNRRSISCLLDRNSTIARARRIVAAQWAPIMGPCRGPPLSTYGQSGKEAAWGVSSPKPDPRTPSSCLAWPIFAKMSLGNDLRTVPAGHSAAGPSGWLHNCGFLVPLHPPGG